MFHEHHRREQVELQGRKRGVVRDLEGGALRDQHPRYEQAGRRCSDLDLERLL
jgi:hypothetical protein